MLDKSRRSFTLVRHIPEWLPWLSYKPLARYGYNIGQEAVHGPLEFVKEAMVSIWCSRMFESSLFASSTGLLKRHLLSRIYRRQRNLKDQSVKGRKKQLLER